MQTFMCDRCGKLYDPIKRGEREYTVCKIKKETVQKKMSRGSKLDLCNDCYCDFVNWFNSVS